MSARRPFRTIRGEKANYKVTTYTTKEARDKAAQKAANKDGERVLIEEWENTGPQDTLNRGWGCVGYIDPSD